MPDGVPFAGARSSTATSSSTRCATTASRVIHVAGFKYAGVSVQRPLHTYAQNVEGTRVVLEAMQAADVANIVFSSSAAVYGTPTSNSSPRTSPSARRRRTASRSSSASGCCATRRPRRPTRASAAPHVAALLQRRRLGRPRGLRHSPHNLFPLVFEALIEGRTPRINGDDYDTPDGTNVRDYVHVGDIAAAHVVAAQRLAAGDRSRPAYNLGSRNGLSVRRSWMRWPASRDRLHARDRPRRPGDPDRIVATGELAARDLDWEMRYSVDEMVRTGWEARRAAAEPSRPLRNERARSDSM